MNRGSATALKDFDAAVEQYHLAAGAFVKGNPEPYKMVWSHRDRPRWGEAPNSPQWPSGLRAFFDLNTTLGSLCIDTLIR